MPDDLKTKGGKSLNLVEKMYFGQVEKTFMESGWHPDSQYGPYNRDDLYRRDSDYSTYEDMLLDDQVDVAMQLKKDLVIGSGWDIVTQKDGDSEVADDIFQRLEEFPDVSLDDQLDDLIHNAYCYGFAVGEKLFKRKPDNSLCFNQVKVRHPSTWLLHQDKHGNVDKYEQVGVKGKDGAGSLIADPSSLIHFINRPKHQNPYGTSDLRAAFQAWFTKRHIVRYYSIFLEKAASPIPAGKYDKNMPKDKVDDLFNVLKKFQAKTAIVYPKDFEIEFLESKSNGEAYIKGINLFNMFIGRALFVPDLLGFSGSESSSGGSQALGREQVDMFLKHIQRRRRALERVVNKHIIQPLVQWNHGEMEHYPRFQLKPITEDDAVQYAKTFIEAMNGKFYKPTPEEINHLRSLLKFPENEDVELIEQGSAGGGGFPGGFDQQPFGEPEVSESLPAKDPEAAQQAIEDAKKAEQENDADDNSKQKVEKAKEKKYQFTPPEGDYKEKVNLELIEKTLDGGRANLLSDLDPIVEDIFDDLIDQIEKKNILGQKPKVSKIESIKLRKLKPLQVMLKKHLRKQYEEQAKVARNEIFKQDFAAPLPKDSFLLMLEQESFEYVGGWEFDVTERARLAMRQAVKSGESLASVIRIIEDEVKGQAVVSLDRYSRTKFTEVMNRARNEEFSRSDVIAGFQYSAVMDGRTTEICAGLHGKKFKKGEEPLPPLHFNCRSVLIPITIFEPFKEDSKIGRKNIDKFIEEKSGRGFGPLAGEAKGNKPTRVKEITDKKGR